jgi:hypothetical protein
MSEFIDNNFVSFLIAAFAGLGLIAAVIGSAMLGQ